ncbi:MAG: glycosyltransferase family 2 protein [Candidatus Shapirobacteria bacterium]
MKISVIITNWNGIHVLKKHLENTIIASPEATEIILIDDASTDNSVIYAKKIQKKYPKLKIICRKNHQGFGKNSNLAVKKAIGDLVVLLNNDLVPNKGYITATLNHFNDPSVFGVGFSELGKENYGKIFWKNGYIQTEPGHSDKTHTTAWLSGGSSIIRRDLFLKLGGFDDIYDPFYFEDTDLGLRAWRSGYKLLWEPKSVVDHQHEYSTSKMGKNFLIYVKERNHLICTLRNFTDKKFKYENIFWQILRILTGPNYIKIILAAKRQLKSHPPQISESKLTDIQILSMFK